MDDLGTLSIAETARAVSLKEISAEEIACYWLRNIATRDHEVAAWIFLDPEQVMAEARSVDAMPGPLPLKGVPVGVKDIIDTADMPTGYGSKLYDGARPASDAACVALAREAGAVILGKTVSTEFAAASSGKTRNPHNLSHTPGGSSSGSAAAVAAGMAPLAFGTQTAGSVIRPASYCGVVGYKPSFGLIGRSGVKTLADSLDTVGVMANRVADAAYFVSVLTGRPGLLKSDLPRAPRIGLYDHGNWHSLSSDNILALRRAEQALFRAGATLIPIQRLNAHDALLDAQQTLMDWEVPRALAYERTRHFDGLSAITQAFISRASPSIEQYDAARALAGTTRVKLPELFGSCDAWLMPSAPGPAPEGFGSTGDPVFNRIWTMLHTPCVTVPCVVTPKGLPVGVQLVALEENDTAALMVALFLETALSAI